MSLYTILSEIGAAFTGFIIADIIADIIEVKK